MEACVARLVIASSTEDCCIKESKWKETILLRTSEKILLSNDEE